MKKIIRKNIYDTETAELVLKNAVGAFGDPDGYEESLYLSPEGNYFMYTNGGETSKYPTEDIKSVAKAAAKKLLAK